MRFSDPDSGKPVGVMVRRSITQTGYIRDDVMLTAIFVFTGATAYYNTSLVNYVWVVAD